MPAITQGTSCPVVRWCTIQLENCSHRDMQNSFLPFPDPSFSRFDSSGFLLLGGGWGVAKEILYCVKCE